jgi:hypothetical protein
MGGARLQPPLVRELVVASPHDIDGALQPVADGGFLLRRGAEGA